MRTQRLSLKAARQSRNPVKVAVEGEKQRLLPSMAVDHLKRSLKAAQLRLASAIGSNPSFKGTAQSNLVKARDQVRSKVSLKFANVGGPDSYLTRSKLVNCLGQVRAKFSWRLVNAVGVGMMFAGYVYWSYSLLTRERTQTPDADDPAPARTDSTEHSNKRTQY